MTETSSFETPEAETGRIIRTATTWLAAAIVAPAFALGPLVAAGWRPADLGVWAAPWWVGVVAAALAVALLVWAACPVLGFPLAQAYRQKVFCARVGITLYLSGFALAGLVVLLAPGG